MKILMLHNRYQIPGGEDISTAMQVELLRSGGHTVDLVEEDNDRIDELGLVRTAARTVWSREAHADVTGRLSTGDYDVMHVQNFFPLLSPSVHRAAQAVGVPTVQSLRNFRLVCPQGMLFRDGAVCTDCVGTTLALPAIRHGCYRDSSAGSAVVSAMTVSHHIARTWETKIDRYVVPSRFTAEIYERGGWDPASIETIPNFVHPDPGVGPGDGGHALYAGRLAPSKGIDVLLEAWTSELSDVPLRIAGDGEMRVAVEQAARAAPNIDYIGQLTPEETLTAMGDATLVVAPTVGIETFGRVAAEAHARGTPVVAAAHGGLADIVEDGETGLLTEPGNPKELAAAVRSLWEDPPRLTSMRRAARRRYLEHYSSAIALERWEDLYGRVLAAAGRRKT